MTRYNKKFKKDYNKMFKINPFTANMMILFMDIADENGQFTLEGDDTEQAEQISILMNIRFEDPKAYQF